MANVEWFEGIASHKGVRRVGNKLEVVIYLEAYDITIKAVGENEEEVTGRLRRYCEDIAASVYRRN